MAEVLWNQDFIQELAARIRQTQEEAAHCQKFLDTTIRAGLSAGWQGISGQLYQDRLETEIKRAQLLQTQLQGLSNALLRAQREQYQNCEEQLKEKLNATFGY